MKQRSLDIILKSTLNLTLDRYYSSVLKSYFSKKFSTSFDFNPYESGAYTERMSNFFRVVIGTHFYPAIRQFDVSKPIEEYDVRKYVKDILAVNDAVFWHELFHLLYTDMGFAKTAIDRFKKYNQELAMQVFKHLFNIIEDVYIEAEGVFQNPELQGGIRYLTYLVENNNSAKPTEWDVSNPLDLTTYIYYLYRLPSVPVIEHPVFEQHKDFLVQAITLILQTNIPYLRVDRTIALTLELFKMFDIPLTESEQDESGEPDMDNIEQGNGLESIPNNANENGQQNIQLRPTNNISDPLFKERADHFAHNSDSVRMGESLLNRSKTLDEIATQSKPSANPTDVDTMLKPTSDLYLDTMVRKVASDSHYNIPAHIQHNAEQAVNQVGLDFIENQSDTVLDGIHQYYSKHISRLASIFDELKDMSRAKTRTDMYTGDKLNMRGLYDPSMIGKYQSDISEMEVQDLAVHLLVDMSGSMANPKSRYAMNSAVLIASALEYSEVPFKVSYFTTENVSYGATLKDFDDPFDKNTRRRLTLLDMSHGLIGLLNAASANFDEAAITNAIEEFEKRTERTKMLIVISDGATCNSRSLLKQVIDSTPDYNIQTFGVGLYSDEVSELYENHLIIDTSDDLQKLPEKLSEFVTKIYATER